MEDCHAVRDDPETEGRGGGLLVLYRVAWDHWIDTLLLGRLSISLMEFVGVFLFILYFNDSYSNLRLHIVTVDAQQL